MCALCFKTKQNCLFIFSYLAAIIWSTDFTPILTEKDIVLMAQLGDPHLVLHGEHGYCLTVFTGAMKYILQYKPEDEEKKKRAAELLDQLGF